ncbi:MAG TPA: Gfo/Idh/MocA family oxidoreductase [Stellaceae bacterium]|nr:Gfo/Idh/MocA family oxidoreductase [Stellaceae bacterium]
MLEVAVVGIGWWGKIIVQTLADSAKLRVRRAVDPDPAARRWAEERGIAVSADLADALADPAVKGVVLATPHSLHTPQIAAAAGAGKHVFCEKPLALCRRDVEASLRRCNAAGVVLAVGHERRFEPPMLELKRLAQGGALGTLLQIEAAFCQDKFLSLPPDNWRLSAAEAPAGPLTATGIHLLDLAVSLLGPAERVSVGLRRLGSDLANGDTLGALVTFKSGANLLLSAILATPFAGRFAVYGNRGWAELRDKAHPEAPEGWVLATCRRGAAPVAADYPASSAVRANLEAFADAAEGRAPYPVPQAEMIATIAALEAIVRAAASGKVEPVEAAS